MLKCNNTFNFNLLMHKSINQSNTIHGSLKATFQLIVIAALPISSLELLILE